MLGYLHFSSLMAINNDLLIIHYFLKSNQLSFTNLLVYVDDIVLAGNDLTGIRHITQLLNNVFKIKDLGDLRFFMGFEVARSNKGINICQRKYTIDSLHDISMIGSKPVSTSSKVWNSSF